MKVEERLLKYVGYHTTSDEASDKIPSSDREFALARELESELKELGLSKVVLTDHCYVYGLLPATKKRSDLLHIWILLLIFPGKMSSHSCCVTMTEAMCCLEAVANT